MKKLYTTLVAVLAITHLSYSQNNTYPWPLNGNIGIGVPTATTKLDVLGTGNFGLLQLTTSGQIPDIRLRQTNAVHPYTRNWSIYTNTTQYGSFELGVSSDRYLDDYTTKFLIDRLGNVGVGTVNPGARLHVAGSSSKTSTAGDVLAFFSTNDSTAPFGLRTMSYGGPTIGNRYVTLQTTDYAVLDGGNIIMQPAAGNVGIGTTNPGRRLDVASGSGVTPFAAVGPNGYILIDNVGGGQSYYQANGFHQFQGISGSPILTMQGDGSVGIGTTTPDPAFKLSVNGRIRSKEIKVETNWSDYVFNDDYNLRSITEVESYIKKNHHLPDVPSAAEVDKNGVNLGETSSLLLKKIEELTLYLIEKDKQVKKQEEEIATLKQQIYHGKQLEQRILALEKAFNNK